MTKSVMQFDEETFDLMLSHEKNKRASTTFAADKAKSPPHIVNKADTQTKHKKVKLRKVVLKLNKMLRKRKFERRQSLSTKSKEPTEDTSITESTELTEADTTSSHIPARIRRLSHKKEMERYILPPREKSNSYLNMYT